MVELTEKELRAKHDFLIQDFEAIQLVMQDEREQCMQDRRFATIPSAQWEDKLLKQYANRPKFEFNKIRVSVNRIVNEYRRNRISVDFVPRDGSTNEELSDFCDGLLRSNEVDCNAQEAYDNAFEEAVLGGIGAWRYTTRYVDELDTECDEQEIVIEPIVDADITVFFDLGAKRQDKSDAKRCYLLESFTHERFEDEFDYPAEEAKPVSISPSGDEYQFDWVVDDTVYVAEVFEVEEVEQNLHIYTLKTGEEKRVLDEDLEDERDFLRAIEAKKKKTRKIKKRKIRKFIMSGDRILEDCGYIAGDSIPIVMNFGQRWFVSNIERAMGATRLAKDAQRLKNMQISDLASLSALNKVEKPIFLPEQIASHDDAWSRDNIEDFPYLTVDPITDAEGNMIASGPVGYTKVPNVPPAMAALLAQTEADMQEILGNQQDGERVAGNVSTETAMLVQNRIDMQTYIYMDNFAKAMKRGGEIWLGMAKEIYVEKKRGVKTINRRNKVSRSIIKNPMKLDDGSVYLENDISNAKMSVVAEVGPASSTANQATVRSLTALLPSAVNETDQSALIASIIYHTDGEGLDDLRDWYRKKLLAMGVAKPTREEQAQMDRDAEQQQQDPQNIYLLAEAERARASAAESQADVLLKQEQANKTRAQTAQIASEIDAAQQQQAIEAIEALGPQITPPDVTGVTIE